MNTFRQLLVGLAVLSPLLGACRPERAPAPPDLRPGRDECAECGMLISDDRFGAAVLPAGEREFRLFDDISCMLEFARDHDTDGPCRAWYVIDHDSRRWIDGASAHYLKADPDRLRTPMGSGVAAFAESGRAGAAQRQFGGTVTSAEALSAGAGEHADSHCACRTSPD